MELYNTQAVSSLWPVDVISALYIVLFCAVLVCLFDQIHLFFFKPIHIITILFSDKMVHIVMR